MTLNKVAWLHPNPLLSEHDVVLPDGYIMRRNDAEAKGFAVVPWPDSERLAMPHPYESDRVVLARGTVVSRETAETAGFTIGERAAVSDARGPRGWRSAIMTLAEAKDRPSATAELLTSQTSETFTVEQARAFLRGLPVETEHTETTEETTMTTNDDPHAARRAEIARSMNAFNKSRGYECKATRVDVKDIEPAKLKRLAEIKYSALHASGKGMTQEAKLIRLALDTHDKIGTPLVQTLAQLGVDASKLIPNS
ncbi:MAG: hypothetical protein QHD01_05505 [Bradyrhizobium sp.]|uniref:hypothetical protein n=1 Tax=Bradyrhizobium sp. TaxID=376 RepID=UPI0029B83E60|nr:hypothetical protein [Bradyrhizobium sp.]MDX3966040.1 hypothetical protein [Bradyrhizobium sp.]